jgi:hypothetical protein
MENETKKKNAWNKLVDAGQRFMRAQNWKFVLISTAISLATGAWLLWKQAGATVVLFGTLNVHPLLWTIAICMAVYTAVHQLLTIRRDSRLAMDMAEDNERYIDDRITDLQ